jgi:hypothetical protein
MRGAPGPRKAALRKRTWLAEEAQHTAQPDAIEAMLCYLESTWSA